MRKLLLILALITGFSTNVALANDNPPGIIWATPVKEQLLGPVVEIGVAPGAEVSNPVTLPEEVNPYKNIIENLTDEEIDILLKILWAEANNQCMDGQRAVLEVIFNRVLAPEWPDTVIGVLSQKGQFATWKMRNRVNYGSMQTDALQLVYEEPMILPDSRYVYFDTRGRNGTRKIKLQGHYFGSM